MLYFKNKEKPLRIIPHLLISLLYLLTTHSLATAIEKPFFNYEQGKYHTPISVTIECVTSDVNIYYTTNGSTPDENSYLYQGCPILVSNHASGDSVTFTGDNDPDPTDENVPLVYRSKIIKAIAINESMEKSEIATVEYVIDLVETTFNIPFDDPPATGGDKHKLDIYHPVGKSNNPVLVFYYGGAWKQGDKNMYMELGNTLAGYYSITTVIANYELSTDPWNAVHPDHIEDVAKAFKWVYENIQEYGGDQENIFLFGQSAGAHLVSLLATDTNYLNAHGLSTDVIKGVISMSGAYDLYDLVEWPNNPLGLDAAEVLQYKTLCLNAFGSWEEAQLDNASPAKFIKMNQPPFLIIGINVTDTFKDMPGFALQSQNFYSHVLALNGPAVELKLLNESDIPQQILDMDFPADYDAHYEEIYCINTVNWNSVSSQMVADYIQNIPTAPELEYPVENDLNISLTPTLSWFKCSEALYYHLMVSTDLNFGAESIIFDCQIADTTWSLSELAPNSTYYWRVKSINALGESEWSVVREFQTTGSSGINPEPVFHPEEITLNLYPNPFNGIVKIQLNGLSTAGKCQIEIYDILGKKVYQEKVDLMSGKNIYTWQPKNSPSGMYLVNVSYEKKRFMNKVMYVK
ncbi:hypothetical protein B6I21_06330 [candidate division KSB1 bacterium 4572_119]|nr:MAG: hypothetical protein B6I21_06330 [candidate division KSB1 bacterium 4572_119]